VRRVTAITETANRGGFCLATEAAARENQYANAGACRHACLHGRSAL
jgi:hypothetical protein